MPRIYCGNYTPCLRDLHAPDLCFSSWTEAGFRSGELMIGPMDGGPNASGEYWAGDEGLDNFLYHAERSSPLSHLRGINLVLGGHCTHVLQAAFRLLPHLRELVMESWCLGDAGIAVFADVLEDGILSELRTLNLSDHLSPSGQRCVSSDHLSSA